MNCIGGISRAVVASDSQAALLSIKTGKSCRLDRVCVQFVWVPAHVGVDGNEDVDILAIQALKLDMVKINVPCAKLKANLLFRIK